MTGAPHKSLQLEPEAREQLWRHVEQVNETELPVVCFSRPGDSHAQAMVRRIVTSGQAWISSTSIKGHTVLRACITHYATQPEDVRALVSALDEVAVPV